MLQKRTLNPKSQSGHKAHEEKKMKTSSIFLHVFCGFFLVISNKNNDIISTESLMKYEVKGYESEDPTPRDIVVLFLSLKN